MGHGDRPRTRRCTGGPLPHGGQGHPGRPRHSAAPRGRQPVRPPAPPTALHKPTAPPPSLMRKVAPEPRYQLIVTTNYDDALERAFNEAREPFDLVAYIADGEHRGKFMHAPPGQEAHVIERPNE